MVEKHYIHNSISHPNYDKYACVTVEGTNQASFTLSTFEKKFERQKILL